MTDVPDIKFNATTYFFQGVRFATSSIDLRPAGYAGFHTMSERVILDASGKMNFVHRSVWPRNDNGHCSR